MVVDDEINITKLLDLSLRRFGYAVLAANDPFLALSMLQAETPDLMVIDLMMPGMNGLELCRRIRARPETSTVPILVFSGRSDSQSLAGVVEAGANGYYAKHDTHDLIEGIRKLLSA